MTPRQANIPREEVSIETDRDISYFCTVLSAERRPLSTAAVATSVMVTSFARRKSNYDAAAVAYARVVEQARQLMFFRDYGVPDTLDGRFELICLHAFLYLHRLKAERPRSTGLSQAFFNTMFADLDRALREMGTGDLSVGKHVKRMARGFYGRIRAYQEGIELDDSALGAALERNLYGTVPGAGPGIGAMAEYVRRSVGELARQSPAELLRGQVRFPAAGPVSGIADRAAGCAASSAGR
jgi:cytochrome b pre-mRNA-processing protein 3